VAVLAPADIFEFGEFRLDRQGEGLSRRDERGVFVPVAVGPRGLDVLAVLVERAGQLVPKEEIMAAVWGRAVVENANLTVQISALRRVLDQGRADGSCIQTVAARGYRFVAPVTPVEPAVPPQASPDTESAIALPPENLPRIVRRRDRGKPAIFAATISVLLVIAGISWWWRPAPPFPAAGIPSVSAYPSFVAPRLSIVVLPFANLSSDPDQQHFADGITEDLTTDLSRITDMLVISRNTAFTYKDKPVDSKKVGHELGVRYLLEGSVQRFGNQLRVSTQLIAAETGAHLWADRFDRDLGDVFQLQNDITRQIAIALNAELIAAEVARPAERPDALDCILRGRAAIARGLSRERYAEVIGWFERALALDPGSVEAQAWLASALFGRASDLHSDTPAADLDRAERLIGQVLAAAPRHPLAHYVKGQLLRNSRRCEEAIPEYELAAQSNRNWISPIRQLAGCTFLTGGGDAAIPLLEQVIRLSPHDPGLAWAYHWIALVHLFQSRPDEAVVWFERSVRANQAIAAPHYGLAVVYGNKEELVHAAAELAEARKRDKTDCYRTIANSRANGDLNTPALHTRFEEIWIAGLRKAGKPEE
jgi:TolB-like protein/DNA-binding winged helix-turn-helix (wHTH) protein